MVLTVELDHANATTSELDDCKKTLLAEADPIYNRAYGGFWMVGRYEQVERIARDNERFISSEGTTIPSLGYPMPAIPLEADGLAHRNYRRVLTPFLRPSKVAAVDADLRARVRTYIDELLASGGSSDVIRTLGLTVPIIATALILGMSEDEGAEFSDAFEELMEAAASGDPERQGAAVDVLTKVIDKGFEKARSEPLDSDSLYSALAYAEVEGKPLTQDECRGLVWNTAGGATETTTLAIGHLVYQLASRPGLFETLLAEPALHDAAIEEVLRLDAPAHQMARTVREPVRVGNIDMKPGDKVLLMFGWANYDTAQFPQPDEIDLSKPKPTANLAFGAGVHRCPGIHLARLEMKIILEELVDRTAGVTLIEEPEHPRLHGGTTWGHDGLQIALAPKTGT